MGLHEISRLTRAYTLKIRYIALSINQKQPYMRRYILLILSLFYLSSCFRWGARAFDDFPEDIALNNTYTYPGKVIIVGAGASGLAAAAVCEKNNIDYLILEASDRYGGRLKRDTSLADFPIDLGAEWIHNKPLIINRLIGLEHDSLVRDLIPYHLNHGYQWDGRRLKKVSQAMNNFRFSFFPEYKFKRSSWYDYVNQYFAQDVLHHIEYNKQIVSIDYSGDQVALRCADGDTYYADKALVTVSIGVLQSEDISFNPPLSTERNNAINRVEFLPGLKVVMTFTEKFYPDAINCKISNGEKAYYDMAFSKESSYNVLGLLATGEAAEQMYSLGSEKDILNHALQELDRMYEGKATAYFTGNFHIEDWGRHRFTLGTWTNAALNKPFDLNALNKSLNRKVYFAGEIYDVHQQLGVPGAILSGYDAIDRMLSDKE